MAVSFFPYKFLRASDLNNAFADCISLSDTNPQTLVSTLNLTSLNASISVQTQQLVVTGDVTCTSTSAISMPVGTTLERPNVPIFGMIRANKDAGTIEVFLQSGKWGTITTTAAAVTASTPPVKLNGPSYGQATSHAIPLGWTAPGGGTAPFTYKVEYRLAGTSNWIVWAQQLDVTYTTVSGLLPAARYEFQITAFNEAGSVTSPVSATNTLGFVAGGPTNLTTSLPTSTSVTLNWVGVQSSSSVAYSVQYAPQGASNWTVVTPPTMRTNATVTGLSPNTTYSFQVVAKSLGASAESDVVQGVTTVAATVAPNSATALVFNNIATDGGTLSFTPPSAGTNPLIYQVQIQLAGTSTWQNYGDATTSTTVVLSGLDSGANYNVRVIATNSAGTSTSPANTLSVAAATVAVGSVAGTVSSGEVEPMLLGPSLASVATGSALPIAGITMNDADAVFAPGTVSLTVSCNSGTLTMTDGNGNQIAGSGTNKISYSATYDNISRTISTLVYTAANKTGADNIAVKVTDQLIQSSTVTIGVTVSASSGTANPPPPPGGTIPVTTTATGQPTDTSGTTARRIRDFLDGFGVSTRMEDPGYNNNWSLSAAASLENMINYLGNGRITTIREWTGSNINPTFLAQVAQNCGVAKYILPIDGWLTGPGYYQNVLNLIASFVTNYPNYVQALEGVFASDVTSNLQAAAQFQPTIYNEAHALGLPAYQMSSTTDTDYNKFGTPAADIANISVFPYYDPNGGTLDSIGGADGYLYAMLQNAKSTTPSVPFSVCSFGWQSFPTGYTPPTTTGIVDEATQAAYVLEFIFSAFKFGATKYIYSELLDTISGTSYEDSGDTYGLFNLNGNPKQAAVAIHNMYQLLYDAANTATTFTPGKLNYAVANKPSIYGGYTNTGYQDAVFQKSNGEWWVIMWNEQQRNTVGGNNVPIAVSPVNVTMSFTGAKSQVTVYDPILGTNPVLAKYSASSVTISLPAYPIFVQVLQ